MNRTVSNSTTFFLRHVFVFATMLLMLLASCSVKASIKTLAGIPTQTGQNIPKGNQSFSVNTIDKCAEFETSDHLIVQKVSFKANDLLPVVLFTAALFFLFSFRTVSQAHIHPLYSGSTKIRSSIPLFLEYRKLLLHFSH